MRRVVYSALIMAALALVGPLALILPAGDTDLVSLGWLVIFLDVLVFAAGGFLVSLSSRQAALANGVLSVVLGFLLQEGVLIAVASSHLGWTDARELLIDAAIVLLPLGLVGVAAGSLLRRLIFKNETSETCR
jgi:hypothetical protein